MYNYIGYQHRYKGSTFSFVLPLFKKNSQIYRSINEPYSGRILSFTEVTISPENIEHVNNDPRTFDRHDLALYGFNWNGRTFVGTRKQIDIRLADVLMYGKISDLEKYDIYFFWGDGSKIKEHVQAFLETSEKGIIDERNFAVPEVITLNADQMAKCLSDIAEILKYRQIIFDYDRMFSVHDNSVYFLRYKVPIEFLVGSFDNLIKKYNSPFYRDLIVHCFMQTNLLRQGISEKREVFYRELFPMLVDFSIGAATFPVDPNSPVIDETIDYSMEQESHTKLSQWDELTILNSSAAAPRMSTLEWLRHLHNLKKEELNPDDDPDIPVAVSSAEQKLLTDRIKRIKREMA